MRYILAFSIILIGALGHGQDPFFYSSENLRLYNNPAMTGLNKSFTADIGYRHQWPSVSNDYITSITTFNQHLNKGNGVSLQLFTDNASSTIFKKEIVVGYAKSLKLSDGHYLSGGVQLAYFQKKLDPSKLTFGSAIDPRGGFVYSPIGQYKTNVSNIDFNAGLMYYGPVFYTGFSIRHIAEPNQSFLINLSGESDRLPRLFFGEIGAKISLGSDWRIVPNAEYRVQGTFQMLLGGVKVKWRKFYLDGGLQDFNTFYTALGFTSDYFHCSYDLVSYTGFSADQVFFAHEFSIGVDLVLFKKENENFFDF